MPSFHSTLHVSDEGIEATEFRGSGTLSPLPDVLHDGLSVVAGLSFASFLSSISLFLFLCWKLYLWRRRSARTQEYNQFIVLIMNLLLADIQQSLGFLLSLQWIVQDGIFVKNKSCSVQAWLIGSGDLASGLWCLTIAVHTAFSVIFSMRLKRTYFYGLILLIWAFIYACNIIQIGLHPNFIYVRAGAWCWVNEKYTDLRLYTHYMWIFISELGVILTYAMILIVVLQRVQSGFYGTKAEEERAKDIAKLLCVYPCVYVVCTLPLASARTAAMAGNNVPAIYLVFAGAMITSNGWLDCLLYALTRRILIFSDDPPSEDCGFDTFTVPWNTDTGSRFGTVTTITAGQANDEKKELPDPDDDDDRSTVFGRVRSKLRRNPTTGQKQVSQPAVPSKQGWRSSFSSHLEPLYTSGNLGCYSGASPATPSFAPPISALKDIEALPATPKKDSRWSKRTSAKHRRTISLDKAREFLHLPRSSSLPVAPPNAIPEEPLTLPGQSPAHAADTEWYVTNLSALGGHVHIPVTAGSSLLHRHTTIGGVRTPGCLTPLRVLSPLRSPLKSPLSTYTETIISSPATPTSTNNFSLPARRPASSNFSHPSRRRGKSLFNSPEPLPLPPLPKDSEFAALRDVKRETTIHIETQEITEQDVQEIEAMKRRRREMFLDERSGGDGRGNWQDQAFRGVNEGRELEFLSVPENIRADVV